MGAIIDDWRERCRGVQEEKGGEGGDGEKRGGKSAGIYANPCPFHRDWTASVSNKLSPRWRVDTEKNQSHVFAAFSDPHISFWLNCCQSTRVVQSATIHATARSAAPPPSLSARSGGQNIEF